jgi:hypothetical protein
MSEPTNIQEAGKKIVQVGILFIAIILLSVISAFFQPTNNEIGQVVRWGSVIIGFILTVACAILIIGAGENLERKE